MFFLPVISLILLVIVFLYKYRDWTSGIASGWLCFTAIAWGMAEIFSLFQVWTKWTVFAGWLVAAAVCVYFIIKKSVIKEIRFQFKYNDIYKNVWKENKGFLSLILIVGFVIGILAILRSQSNVDSMVYHLPRIMHWIQNKSVGHYATGTDLQVRYPALAEYLVAQILILGASDRLANFFQMWGYFASAMMIYGISRKLGVSRKVAFLPSLIYMFMPMALAQSFTTQTDNIACLFLLVYLHLIIGFIRKDRLLMDNEGFGAGIKLAASVMFGYLCKPTICFAMLVFFVWMCIRRLCQRDSIAVLLKYVVVGGMTAIILYLPLCYKSYQTYIKPYQTSINEETAKETNESEGKEDFVVANAANALAPDNFNVINAIKDPSEFVMTCIQNVGRNSMSESFPKWNEWVEEAVVRSGNILGKDTSRFSIPKGRLFTYCDTATNPVIMFVLAGAIICIAFKVSRLNKEQLLFSICAILSFFIQCGLMGYTPYRTRYLVGVMAILSIMVALVVDNLRVNKATKVNVAVFIIALASVGAMNALGYEVANVKDGFQGESDHQYFVENDEYETVYRQLVEHINNNHYTQIGIVENVYYEYILWACIDGLKRLESVNLQNSPLGIYEDLEYRPECVVRVDDGEIQIDEEIQCHGKNYVCEWTNFDGINYYAVYAPVE